MSIDPEFAGAREAQGATLQVATRRGGVVTGGHLNIEDDARGALLGQVREALDDLEEREARLLAGREPSTLTTWINQVLLRSVGGEVSFRPTARP